MLVGTFILFQIETGDGVRFFSNNRSFWGDLFFSYGTKVGEEPAYIIAAIVFLFVRFRYIFIIGFSGVLVTIVSHSTKALFSHDRPKVFFTKLGEIDQLNLIEGVKLLTGATSFPSGHTMSGFALFSLLAFWSKEKKGAALFFFFCAVVVGVSRIYLVQHFVKDVYLGAIMGVAIGAILYLISKRYPYNNQRLIDQNIYTFRKNKEQKA